MPRLCAPKLVQAQAVRTDSGTMTEARFRASLGARLGEELLCNITVKAKHYSITDSDDANS